MTRTAVCLIAAVLLLSFVVTAQAAEPPTGNPLEQPRMYRATTILMDPIALSDTSSPETRSARVAILTGLARGMRVMTAASNTLSDLGLDLSPSALMESTRVYAAGCPGTLGIDVHMADAKHAKVAADVIAAELKRIYGEIRLAGPRQTREFLEAQAEELREQVKRHYALLYHHQSDSSKRGDVGEIAVLEAEAQIARDNYIAIGARLFDAKLAEQEAAILSALMTVNSAYVYPAR